MPEKFIIQPHFRLQEWVAEEKGYFRDEGLEYTFNEEVQKTSGQVHDKGTKVGAYQSLESGRASDVSCACHWTVNVAAAAGHGKLYSGAYSVTPAAIFRAAGFAGPRASGPGRCPDLSGLPVGQPLLQHSGARTVPADGSDQAVLQRWHAVQTHGSVC